MSKPIRCAGRGVAVTILVACGACVLDDARFTPSDDADPPGPAPDTQITAAPPALDNAATATFEFTSTDPAAHFECALDGAAFAACTSPAPVAGLVTGDHGFAVRAVSAAGVADPSPATHAWTVDLRLPETAIDSGPSGTVAVASASFLFSSPNGDAATRFECSADGAAFAACTSPSSHSGLGDGPHHFAVRARNGAGALDPSPAVRDWTVDTVAPDTTITDGPTGLSSGTDATFTFAASETGVTFACDLDGGGFEACDATATFTGLAEGSHALAVRAVDAAGNTDGTPATRTWTIDAVAPDTTLTQTPGSPSSADVVFGFTGSEAGATFDCALDAAAFAPCASPRALTGLPDGPHTFRVRAVDGAGNADPTPASHGWTVDASVPDTQITAGPTGAVNTTSAQLAFVAVNAAGATFECALDAAAFAACTSPVNLSGLAAGAHDFRVRARSAAGVVDPSPALRNWIIDVTAPTTTIAMGPTGTVPSTTASFAFTSDDAAASFECDLDSAGFAPCAATTTLATLAQGGHTLRVRAVDAAGNRDATPATRSWTVDTVPPDTTLTTTPTNPSNQLAPQFGFTAEAGATFECSLDGAVFTACSSPQPVSVASGSHTFAVRAVDAAANVDPSPASYAWSVDTIVPNTFIASGPADPSGSASATFQFSASETASYECALDAGAYAACASPYTLTVSDARHTLSVRARDAAGNVDPSPATWSWTTDATPPVITITAPTAAQTAPYTLLTFSLSEAATTTCRWDGATAATACASGDERYLAPGAHAVEVRAVDALGNLGTRTVTWTVSCGAPPELPGAILSLHFEDAATSQSFANTANPSNPAYRGRAPTADSQDATTVAGRFGAGLHIDNVPGDFHQLARWDRAGSTTLSQWTLEFWVRIASSGTIFYHANPSGSGRADLYMSGYPAFGGSGISSGISQLPHTPMAADRWHYVAITYDGASLQSWIDGVPASLAAAGLNFVFGHFDFGAQTENDSGTQVIDLDEVALGNQALTPAQLRARYCPAP